MNIDKEREAFEAWATSKGWNTKRAWTNERVYASSEVNQLWDSWQARAALDEQKAGPSDEEIEALAKQHLWAHAENVGAGNVYVEGEIAFARALLSKYAAPAPKGEPVATRFCSLREYEILGKNVMWSTCKPFNPDEMWDESWPDKYVVQQLYTAPVNEQDAKDAQRYRWLRYAAPAGSRVIEDIYEMGLCAEDLDAAIDAAIAQQGKGE